MSAKISAAAPGPVPPKGDKSPRYRVMAQHLGRWHRNELVTQKQLAATGVDDDRLAELVAEGLITDWVDEPAPAQDAPEADGSPRPE